MPSHAERLDAFVAWLSASGRVADPSAVNRGVLMGYLAVAKQDVLRAEHVARGIELARFVGIADEASERLGALFVEFEATHADGAAVPVEAPVALESGPVRVSSAVRSIAKAQARQSADAPFVRGATAAAAPPAPAPAPRASSEPGSSQSEPSSQSDPASSRRATVPAASAPAASPAWTPPPIADLFEPVADEPVVSEPVVSEPVASEPPPDLPTVTFGAKPQRARKRPTAPTPTPTVAAQRPYGRYVGLAALLAIAGGIAWCTRPAPRAIPAIEKIEALALPIELANGWALAGDRPGAAPNTAVVEHASGARGFIATGAYETTSGLLPAAERAAAGALAQLAQGRAEGCVAIGETTARCRATSPTARATTYVRAGAKRSALFVFVTRDATLDAELDAIVASAQP